MSETRRQRISMLHAATRSRIYISGPMRGKPDHNFPAFAAAAALFRELGWVVANPAEIGTLFANNPAVHGAEYIREDLLHVARCHAIALLPGWEQSTGARCEVAAALTLDMTFYDATTGLARIPPARVIVNGGYEREVGVVPSLDELSEEINAWQLVTFPHANAASKCAHLAKEVLELAKNPTDPEELADCFFLIAGMAHVAGVDLAAAVHDKLVVNKARKWGKPDAHGVVEHVRDE